MKSLEQQRLDSYLHTQAESMGLRHAGTARYILDKSLGEGNGYIMNPQTKMTEPITASEPPELMNWVEIARKEGPGDPVSFLPAFASHEDESYIAVREVYIAPEFIT